MQVIRHCTVAMLTAVAVAALAAAGSARITGAQGAASPQAGPGAGGTAFVVFVNGRQVGREQVTVSRTAAGWTIVSTGRLGEPLNLVNNRFEITYAPDWAPIELKIDARVGDRAQTLATSFTTTTAITEVTQDGVTNTKTDQITARTVVLPNNFFGAYEALAARLGSLAPGAELPVYVAPQGEIRLRLAGVRPAAYQTPAGTVDARRFSVIFLNPTGPLEGEVTVDDRNRVARLDIGGVITVVRQDLAGVAIRQQTFRNPTDTDTTVPASGFGLAGTITTPPAAGRLRSPAVVLVAGAGAVERDATVAGIPIFGQLAGQLADRGFVVLRYDKRGAGQSGGRTERVTLADFAEDAIAAVKFLARRKDVDKDRIFLAGHGEGASVAMLAAREKRIAGLVLMAGMGTTGRDLILEQQERMLEPAAMTPQERTEKIELQKKIIDAAMTGQGWEALPPDVRALVDTPWYRSMLTFDPARIMPRIKQPVLVLHGALDQQVPPHHAERLAGLAQARKEKRQTDVRLLPGLNHLFVPAKTGEIAEYAALEPKTISPQVAEIIAGWAAGIAR